MNAVVAAVNNSFEKVSAFVASFSDMGTLERVFLVFAIVVSSHVIVRSVRYMAKHLLSNERVRQWTKLRTIIGLLASTLIFILYFGAFGLVLHEFGVSLTAYLASASIIGLAIGFGSQGVVQDVVTGLTVIFSDLFQVDDLVEISGQTGIVQNIGMRFTSLLNPLGALVYIPNRTIANVIVYSRGYIRCFADITLSAQPETANKMMEKLAGITQGFVQHYPGILRAKPEMGEVESTPTGRLFTRVKFRIWPGRNGPIETAYKQELVATLKTVDSDFADWMVTINNEVSESPNVRRRGRKSGGQG